MIYFGVDESLGLPHSFSSKSMLLGDTSCIQLPSASRYQYIKILNTIRKQNQIGAGASEAPWSWDVLGRWVRITVSVDKKGTKSKVLGGAWFHPTEALDHWTSLDIIGPLSSSRREDKKHRSNSYSPRRLILISSNPSLVTIVIPWYHVIAMLMMLLIFVDPWSQLLSASAIRILAYIQCELTHD